jgi:phenolic acid decarboxylase
MALYVIEDDKVSYIQHEGTYAGEITTDATLDIVTITKIAEINKIQITLPEAKALPVENKEN